MANFLWKERFEAKKIVFQPTRCCEIPIISLLKVQNKQKRLPDIQIATKIQKIRGLNIFVIGRDMKPQMCYLNYRKNTVLYQESEKQYKV
jgi:hypothetical protein